MKLIPIITAFAATAVALPTDMATEQGMTAVEMRAELEARSDLESRQTIGSTVNELTNGACRQYTFIFARGSTETGNIGLSVGPPTCRGLKQAYGSNNVACQGVGSPYTASIEANALPEGTTTAAYGEAQRLFNLAHTKCPDTIIVGGGYSQGAAVMTAAVRRLSTDVQDQIAGVVLYGDTQKQQDNDQIPNFPKDKVDIICQPGDLVCVGTLTITPAHLTYGQRASEGVAFLAGKITAAQAKIKARNAKREVEVDAATVAAAAELNERMKIATQGVTA